MRFTHDITDRTEISSSAVYTTITVCLNIFFCATCITTWVRPAYSPETIESINEYYYKQSVMCVNEEKKLNHTIPWSKILNKALKLHYIQWGKKTATFTFKSIFNHWSIWSAQKNKEIKNKTEADIRLLSSPSLSTTQIGSL